jgi:hypothetical protein
MAHDLTGDLRDELIDGIPVDLYLHSGPAFQRFMYLCPLRPPLYNESNYAPVVSRPAWSKYWCFETFWSESD